MHSVGASFTWCVGIGIGIGFAMQLFLNVRAHHRVATLKKIGSNARGSFQFNENR